jgi:aerobic-type carbon monoxide dehydrogenase small subunit (CoxS/CutS family)
VKRKIAFDVNGKPHKLLVDPCRSLLQVLREDLGLTGTKNGCNQAECGSCTVLLDGKAVYSCITLVADADGRRVTTIEGLSQGAELDPIQEAFIDHGAIQCGFCTPGMVMSAKALLQDNPSPTEADVKRALAGNLCRCTGYTKIVEAVISASAHKEGE